MPTLHEMQCPGCGYTVKVQVEYHQEYVQRVWCGQCIDPGDGPMKPTDRQDEIHGDISKD